MKDISLPDVLEFEWDDGNSHKPRKHGLSLEETEQAFFDKKKMFGGWRHSTKEPRITLLGKNKKEKVLNITYTIRKNKVRVITARIINKKEVHLYEEKA